LHWVDAVGQAELVRSGEVSAAELTELAIERIERLDPSVNALVFRRFERARQEAAAGFAGAVFGGVPFLLKDAVQHSEGDRYQQGMRFLRDHPWTSPHDSELTRRYKAAGLVLLGRTNVPELTLSRPPSPWRSVRRAIRGRPPTPREVEWRIRRRRGIGHGPRGARKRHGGSIRIPASCCGLVA